MLMHRAGLILYTVTRLDDPIGISDKIKFDYIAVVHAKATAIRYENSMYCVK